MVVVLSGDDGDGVGVLALDSRMVEELLVADGHRYDPLGSRAVEGGTHCEGGRRVHRGGRMAWSSSDDRGWDHWRIH